MHDWGQHNRPGQGIIKGTVSRECSKYPIKGTVSRECSKYPIKGTVSGVQRGYKFATAVFVSDLPIHYTIQYTIYFFAKHCLFYKYL